MPKHYEDSIANIMITHGTIQDRIEKLAKDIFYDVFNEVSGIFFNPSRIPVERNNATNCYWIPMVLWSFESIYDWLALSILKA